MDAIPIQTGGLPVYGPNEPLVGFGARLLATAVPEGIEIRVLVKGK